MKNKATVIALANAKGGVGKTTSTFCIGAGLAKNGKKVLLIDLDPQGDLTKMCGIRNPNNAPDLVTMANVMNDIISFASTKDHPEIQHHPENFDFVPANRLLSNIEVSLVNALSREKVLSEYLESVKPEYDYILIDCRPALGMLVINAFAAANYVMIPVQAEYLSADGIADLIFNVKSVKRAINKDLEIMGAFITMIDKVTNFRSGAANYVLDEVSKYIPVFKTSIPAAIRVAEVSTANQSIFLHEPDGEPAKAYAELVKEVESYVEQN